MINTHGIKISGLKLASGATKSLRGYYSGEYVELFYDTDSGKVWAKCQYSLGQNTWTEYHDKSVVKICNLSSPTTMQEVADLVADHIKVCGDA